MGLAIRGSRLLVTTFAALCLVFMPIGRPASAADAVAATPAEQSPAPQEGTDSAPSAAEALPPAADASRLIIDYVIAAEETGIRRDYAAKVSRLAADYQVLAAYGLASAEQAQFAAELSRQAQAELGLRAEAEQAAHDALRAYALAAVERERPAAPEGDPPAMAADADVEATNADTETANPDAEPANDDVKAQDADAEAPPAEAEGDLPADAPQDGAGPAPPSEALPADDASAQEEMPLIRDEAALAAVRQALAAAEQAARGAEAAETQYRLGLIGLEALLEAHRSRLDAGLAAVEAKRAYYASICDAYLAARGAPIPASAFLAEVQRDDAALASSIVAQLARLSAADDADRPAVAVPSPGEGRPAVELVALPVHAAVPPYRNDDGEVYVPLRPYAEALHFEVAWDGETRQATLLRGDGGAAVTIGSKEVRVEGKTVELSRAPMLRQGYTFVPLSFFTDALSLDVYWNADLQHGLIFPWSDSR